MKGHTVVLDVAGFFRRRQPSGHPAPPVVATLLPPEDAHSHKSPDQLR